MTEDNPPKFETIADLPDDDLKKIISKYLDYLCDMGISIERINSEGKEYSDNLLKTKSLFDNNKLTPILQKTLWSKTLASLVMFSPYYESRVLLYTHIHMELDKHQIDYFEPIKDERSRIESVSRSFERLQNAIPSSSHSEALIQLFTRIIEVVEYNLLKSVNLLPDTTLFDLEEIFSVCGKVKRNTVYVTRGKALRDAFNHSRYDTDGEGYDITIKINNQKDGYNFQCKYTLPEFANYIDKLHKLHILFVNTSYLFYLNNLFRHYFSRVST